MFVYDVCIEKFTPNFFNFYQILKKICWKWQNLLKKWKNGIFSAFFILDFFQNHERYKKIVFTGMDWMPWGTFKPNIGSLNPETKKNPLLFSQQLPFLHFFGCFWPKWTSRSTFRQHMLTKILRHLSHALKSPHFRYQPVCL